MTPHVYEVTTAKGAPVTGDSLPEKVLEPDTGGQFIWYRKTSSSHVSGTYSTPLPSAAGIGKGMGPSDTSNNPYGRGGAGGVGMSMSDVVATGSPSLPLTGERGRLPGP